MPPSISRRAFIEFPPASPSEPTSTLVLTSPQRRFVDIRISTRAADRTPETNRYEAKSTDTDAGRLDWAFAGVSQSEWIDAPRGQAVVVEDTLEKYKPFAASNAAAHAQASRTLPEQPGGKVQHTVWTHTIDSRTRRAETVRDEGDMLDLPTLGLTLERGRMRDPDSGDVVQYVEGWVEEEILPTRGAGGGEERVACCVLEMEDAACEAKGAVVRVGRYCQGIVRVGDEIAVQRWSWKEAGGWAAEFKMGELELPVNFVKQHGGWAVGQVTEVVDAHRRKLAWKVVEVEGS